MVTVETLFEVEAELVGSTLSKVRWQHDIYTWASPRDSFGQLMNYALSLGEPQRSNLTKLAVQTLKCCPLCRAVNAMGNPECFSCGWAGRFDHDSDSIHAGLNALIERCPELKIALEKEQPKGALEKLKRILRPLFRKPLDIRI